MHRARIEVELADDLRRWTIDVLAALRESHRRNTCTDCWYSCRGEVEVLYHPRGFADRMSSLLWQDSTQPGAAPEVFMELSRRRQGPEFAPEAVEPIPSAIARSAGPSNGIPLKLQITPDAAGVPMTRSFEPASAVCAKEETR